MRDWSMVSRCEAPQKAGRRCTQSCAKIGYLATVASTSRTLFEFQTRGEPPPSSVPVEHSHGDPSLRNVNKVLEVDTGFTPTFSVLYAQLMNSPTDAQKTVLITGAGSGFGLEYVKLFAKDGYALVLTDKTDVLVRKAEAAARDAGSSVLLSAAVDLQEPFAAKKVFDLIVSRGIHVTHLVNNAGLGIYGKLVNNSQADEHELLMVNVVALTELCQLFMKPMSQAGFGRVLNVASISAFQAGAHYATYFASKAFVLLLSEALILEHANDNVSVTAVCPGVSPTSFFDRAGMKMSSPLLKSYFIPPARVAHIGYTAMQAGKSIVITGKRNWLVGITYRIFPRKIINAITAHLVHVAAKG